MVQMDIQKQTKFDKFDNLDQKIASLVAANPSITDSELSEELGYSRQTVNKRRNSKSVIGILKSINDQSTDKILSVFNKSIAVVEESLSDTDSRVRLSAALGYLRVFGEYAKAAKSIEVEPREIVYITKWGTKNEI